MDAEEAAAGNVPPEENLHYESTGWQVEMNRERVEYRCCEAVHIGVEYANDKLGRTLLGEDSALAFGAPYFCTLAWITTVRIPREYDADNNEVTPTREEFLKSGSRKCPNPTEGDSEQDPIQRIGFISNLDLSAEEILSRKRRHWSCESAHHILDVTFREDECNARVAKFNASLIRKLAYNIVRLALYSGDIEDECSSKVLRCRVCHRDSLLKKYLFSRLPRIHMAEEAS